MHADNCTNLLSNDLAKKRGWREKERVSVCVCVCVRTQAHIRVGRETECSRISTIGQSR